MTEGNYELVITRDGDGNTFLRHKQVYPELEARPEPQAAAIDRTKWKFIDSCLTGVTIGFLCFATIKILGWTFQAIAWAVSR